MPAQNTLQNANPHDHVELKNLAIVDPLGKFQYILELEMNLEIIKS